MKWPFVRGEGNRRGGHGVGLTIVRRLSDRFGWPISIVSEPGVGTTVEITFPGSRLEPA
jgi:signal transduction histidine kinase